MRFEVGGYLGKAPAGEYNCKHFPSRLAISSRHSEKPGFKWSFSC